MNSKTTTHKIKKKRQKTKEPESKAFSYDKAYSPVYLAHLYSLRHIDIHHI